MKEDMPERYFYGGNKVVKIGQILKGVIPKRDLQKIDDVWRSIAGKDIYQGTRIDGVKNGVLYMSVESAAMSHHLTNFEKSAIIAKINETLGVKYIEDIRFRVGIV